MKLIKVGDGVYVTRRVVVDKLMAKMARLVRDGNRRLDDIARRAKSL